MTSKMGELSREWAKAARLDYWYESTSTSTNKIAKENAFTEKVSKSPITVYFTDHQSQGKGRGTHQWINSETGSCFLSSWSFYIHNIPQPLLSCFIGLAVYRAMYSTWPYLPWSLKAPNDLYLADKKVGGLLIETISQSNNNGPEFNRNLHRLIIGFGFNISGHPLEIENASHLNAFTGSKSPNQNEWNAFLDRLLMELSLTVSNSQHEISENEKNSLLHALNRLPLLTEPYLNLDNQGNIFTASRKISWYDI